MSFQPATHFMCVSWRYWLNVNIIQLKSSDSMIGKLFQTICLPGFLGHHTTLIVNIFYIHEQPLHKGLLTSTFHPRAENSGVLAILNRNVLLDNSTYLAAQFRKDQIVLGNKPMLVFKGNSSRGEESFNCPTPTRVPDSVQNITRVQGCHACTKLLATLLHKSYPPSPVTSQALLPSTN